MKTSSGQKANVLLVGSGGVGTMAAYALEKGGRATITAVLRSNFSVVKDQGFHIRSLEHGKVKNWRPSTIRNTMPNVADEKLDPYDFVVVTTKNIADIPPSTAEMIAPSITPGHTAILLLQNGLNIERPIIAAFPSNPVLSGISIIGASESPHGAILHDNPDISYVGAFDNPNIPREVSVAAAKTFVDLYSACPAVRCSFDEDVPAGRWKKLLYNASFNSTAAVLRMDVSRMRASEHVIDELVRPVMLEIVAVAKAKGVELPPGLVEDIITVDLYDTFFKPSMYQDVEKGNFIEFENIIGEPLREAERLGVAAPTLKVLYALLKGLQFQIKEARGLVEAVWVDFSIHGN
ncbi:putative 2-dehydropantoate 2-reductase [Cryphonectria parasitica EP155]|uniref:2-dehydropantoate 2-reductase n=1 Tax=Cryphonectria parasitica (strain ATCC 38755 / EP155) TaxID=660469 RepID=A0A9P4XXU1_CRYP1|nr:putative 2-dehydropantoate 2-reductase [Cryphonectria parasitica EP155]KAF3762988.1 putative 2-dehydropantoate 2-reductase [Cryphonectria parasitica EP155]